MGQLCLIDKITVSKRQKILNHEILGWKSPNKGPMAITMLIASVRFSKLLKWLPLEFDHATPLEFDHATTRKAFTGN